MRPIVLPSIVAIMLVLAVSLLIATRTTDPAAPRLSTPQISASIGRTTYNPLPTRPSQGANLAITISSGGTNEQVLIYDLEKRQASAEVINGSPHLIFGSPPQLLCSQPVPRNGVKERFSRLIARLSGGRISFSAAPVSARTYWLLNLWSNTAVHLGDIPGPPNFSLFPSPDFHYCFTVRPGPRQLDCYLFDFQKRSVENLDMPRTPCDWWDQTRILIQTTNEDLVLYDVTQRTATPFLPFKKLARFLVENDLVSTKPFSIRTSQHPFAVWNGHENDFYLTEPYPSGDSSLLLKVERPEGTLRMLPARSKIQRPNLLDPGRETYFYNDREGTGASLVSSQNSGLSRTMPFHGVGDRFEHPTFYKGSLIYIRSNALWQVSLNSTNAVKLFPN